MSSLPPQAPAPAANTTFTVAVAVALAAVPSTFYPSPPPPTPPTSPPGRAPLLTGPNGQSLCTAGKYILICLNSIGTIGSTASLANYTEPARSVLTKPNVLPAIVYNPYGLFMKGVDSSTVRACHRLWGIDKGCHTRPAAEAAFETCKLSIVLLSMAYACNCM